MDRGSERFRRRRVAWCIERFVSSLPTIAILLEFKLNKMKVTISARQVYFKTTKIAINIPNDIPANDVGDYLNKNPELYSNSIYRALEEEEHEEGIGMHSGHWTDENMDSEWRYDCKELKIGGHV
jgi:hypothetical protein